MIEVAKVPRIVCNGTYRFSVFNDAYEVARALYRGPGDTWAVEYDPTSLYPYSVREYQNGPYYGPEWYTKD